MNENRAHESMLELESLPQTVPLESCEIPIPISLRIVSTILMIILGLFLAGAATLIFR
jgi:hypothetical protein